MIADRSSALINNGLTFLFLHSNRLVSKLAVNRYSRLTFNKHYGYVTNFTKCTPLGMLYVK